MKRTFLQSTICFVSTVFTVYALNITNYNPILISSVIILLVSICSLLFSTTKILLSGFITGVLAGTINLENIFSVSNNNILFLILATCLALVTALGYLIIMWAVGKYNLNVFYGNGVFLPSISGLSGLLFIIFTKYILQSPNINYLNNNLFLDTSSWHLTIIFFALIGVGAGYKINQRIQQVYNQFGITLVFGLILVVCLLVPFLPFFFPEIILAVFTGLFIGISRLPEYSSLNQYLTATILFGLLYILFKNIVSDIPMLFSIIGFLAVWMIQKIFLLNKSNI